MRGGGCIGGRAYLLQLAFSCVAVLFAELSDSALPACGFRVVFFPVPKKRISKLLVSVHRFPYCG